MSLRVVLLLFGKVQNEKDYMFDFIVFVAGVSGA